MTDAAAAPRWHAALAWAVLGEVPVSLPEPGGLDLPAVAADLVRSVPGGRDALQARVGAQRAQGTWPHPVPGDLRAGLGAAQFTAALAAVIDLLDLGTRSEPAVRAARTLSPEERRLLEDVPPHHGA